MTSNLLAQALRTATDTKAIAAGPGAVAETGRLFAQAFPGKSAVLVADENTWAAAGEAVRAALSDAGVPQREPLIFPGTPTLYAGYDNVERVREYLAVDDAVACCVAAGTLNDIVKLASGELGRSYLVVGTAASMDGYAAFGASITVDGFKNTRSCPAPAAIVADLDVMAAAPSRLSATGYGDLIEKIPGGADWLVADELGIEPVQPHIWALVQDPLRAALGNPAGCRSGDPAAIEGLAEGLLMSGLSMQAHQSSRPASGAGHNFSHQWEMEGHGRDWEPPLSHGNKVGIGAVAMCALYEQVLRLDVPALDTAAAVAAWPDARANDERVAALQPVPAIRASALPQSRAKYVAPEAIAARVDLIKAHWPRIIERVTPQLVTAEEAAGMLRDAGAPHHPAGIGIGLEKLKTTYLQAQTIRNRYTILDALAELGVLRDVVDSLFLPGGYWYGHADPPDFTAGSPTAGGT